MKNNNKTLHPHQVGILIFLMPLVFKMVTLPSIMAGYMGNDAWIGILLLTCIELMQLYIIFMVNKLGGVSAFKEKFGTFVSLLIFVPFILLAVAKVSVFLAEAVGYVSSYLFYNITPLGVVFVFIIVTCYIGLKGSRAIGRLAEVVVLIIPIVFVIGFLFGKVEFKFDNIMPILVEGMSPVLKGMIKVAFWSFDFSPLLFIKVSKTENKKLIFPLASIITLVSIVFLYIIFIANYMGSAHLITNAFAQMALFNIVTTEIGKLDWPAVLVWLMAACINLSLYIFAIGEVGTMFKIKSPYMILGFCAVLGIIRIYFLINIEDAITFAESIVGQAFFILGLAIPIILAIMLFIEKQVRKKRHIHNDLNGGEHEQKI